MGVERVEDGKAKDDEEIGVAETKGCRRVVSPDECEAVCTRSGSRRSPSRGSGVSFVELHPELLFGIGSPDMSNRRPTRPRRTLNNHDQLRRSNPLVSQPPRLEMSYPPVHLPFDGTRVSQRCSARTEFDQKRGRRSPVSNSDAFDQKVGTAFERVLLDHSKNRNGNKDARSARLFNSSRRGRRGMADVCAKWNKGERCTYFASYRRPVELLIHSAIRPRKV